MDMEIHKAVLQFTFRSETALGFCLFSYGGNIQLSLIADKSIVRDEKLLTNILKDIAHEIDAAYNSIKQSQKHPRKKVYNENFKTFNF